MGAISEGKLKAIAVSTRQRFPMLPDIPTFDELGLKDFELTAWLGIVAPGGHVARDRDQAQRGGGCGAQGSGGRRAASARSAWFPVPTAPEQFSAFINNEIAKASKVSMAGDKPN